MSEQPGLYPWEQTLATHLPPLSKPQAQLLALWSYAMLPARSCGLSSVVLVLWALLGQKPDALPQRLREFSYAKEDKAAAKRQESDGTTCFAPLLAWVLSWWQAHQIALALDAS